MGKFLDLNNNINNLNGLFTRKSAFTLAEVLITLGIIGIVAAITKEANCYKVTKSNFCNKSSLSLGL